MIQPTWCEDLHAYLGGIIRAADGIAESVGGVSDHVHPVIGLRTTHRLADVLRELKAVSSGYGAFTVGASQLEAVRHYIEQQAEHYSHAHIS